PCRRRLRWEPADCDWSGRDSGRDGGRDRRRLDRAGGARDGGFLARHLGSRASRADRRRGRADGRRRDVRARAHELTPILAAGSGLRCYGLHLPPGAKPLLPLGLRTRRFVFMFKRQLTAALICAIGVLTFVKSQAAPATRAQFREVRLLVERIGAYRRVTWHWGRVIGVPRTPTANTASRSPDLAYRRWVMRLWQQRASRILRLASAPPHRSSWSCIHRYEGGWHANTGNGYFGGLQMDLTF